jgi:hypothetical protein
MLFRVLWWFDALITAVVLYFFAVGLGDGSVSSFNAGLWAMILLGLATVMVGSRALHVAGHHKTAIGLSLVMAVPGALAVLFLVIVLTTNPRWN